MTSWLEHPGCSQVEENSFLVLSKISKQKSFCREEDRWFFKGWIPLPPTSSRLQEFYLLDHIFWEGHRKTIPVVKQQSGHTLSPTVPITSVSTACSLVSWFLIRRFHRGKQNTPVFPHVRSPASFGYGVAIISQNGCILNLSLAENYGFMN